VLTIAKTSTIDTILTGPIGFADVGQGGVISDGTWTWVRRSLTGEPLAFALLQGQRLLIDREPVLDVDSILDCAVGEKGPTEWEIDTHQPDQQRPCALAAVSKSMEEPCAASVE
jgi:hypothetical protein